MSRVTLVLKTNTGGMWILPQVRELAARGAAVTVVLPAGPGRLTAALADEAVTVVPTDFTFSFRPGPRLLRGLLSLRATLRSTRPDVVFYHLYASALAVRLASAGMRVRRVHMVAGPLYLESRGIRLVERLLCRLDTHVIAGSDHTRERYRDIGMPARRLSAVPYGVDTDRFRRGPDARATLLGCPPGTFVAVMVAYVYAPKRSVFPGTGIKGHDVLLDAWSTFVRSHPSSLLVLVGGGFDAAGERHRQELLSRFGVADDPTVLWLDSVDDVRPLYSSADVSVSPSLSENHGAALEASAMSLPCIVSAAGALPEAVVDGETGWVVPVADRPSLARALGEAAAEHAAGTLRARGDAARALVEQRFSTAECAARVADAVLGRHRVVTFTEQRAWWSADGLVGRKALSLETAAARRAAVRLVARTGAQEPGGAPLAPGTTGVSLPWPRSLFSAAPDAVRTLSTLVREVRRADVVFVDQPGVVGSAAAVVARLLRRPLAVNVVGDSEESVDPRVIPGLKGRVAHVVLPAAQRWSTARAELAAYVPSRALMRKYPASRAGRTYTITTATPLGEPRPRAYTPGPVSVVTVATLEQPYKGIAELVDAVAMCRAHGDDVSLTVVGGGRLREQLETYAERRLGEHSRFTGHLYGPDLYAELGRHQLFCLASWTEGLPRALVEAMADGMPAVATAVGGVPDLLDPEHVVPSRSPEALSQAITTLVRDGDVWKRAVEHNMGVSEALILRSRADAEAFVDAITSPDLGRVR